MRRSVRASLPTQHARAPLLMPPTSTLRSSNENICVIRSRAFAELPQLEAMYVPGRPPVPCLACTANPPSGDPLCVHELRRASLPVRNLDNNNIFSIATDAFEGLKNLVSLCVAACRCRVERLLPHAAHPFPPRRRSLRANGPFAISGQQLASVPALETL